MGASAIIHLRSSKSRNTCTPTSPFVSPRGLQALVTEPGGAALHVTAKPRSQARFFLPSKSLNKGRCNPFLRSILLSPHYMAINGTSVGKSYNLFIQQFCSRFCYNISTIGIVLRWHRVKDVGKVYNHALPLQNAVPHSRSKRPLHRNGFAV